jgi:outer membrane protein
VYKYVGFEKKGEIMISRFGALAIAAAGIFFVSAASAQTLEEALVMAYQNNPTLQSQRASLRATDESVSQALSGWRPTVTLSGDAGLSHSDGVSTGSSDSKPRSAALRVTQPLYRGGRTVNGVAQAEANIQAARQALRQTEQGVLQGTVRAYMDVLRDESVVELNQANLDRLGRQLDATRDRFEVGELTRTDVAQAEARVSGAISSLVAAQGVLASSRATFRRVIGLEPLNLSRVPALGALPEDVEGARLIALEENPVIRQAIRSEEASRAAVEVANGVILPSVNLSSSLSRSYDTSSFNYRTDAVSVTANVTVPLYQSGSEYSKIRQAKQTNSQRRIDIETQRRSVIESVTKAWATLNSATEQIRANVDQVIAAEVALDGVQQEAEVGARTVLDVLDAEQELLNAQVTLVRTERDEFVAGFDLRVALGRLSAEQLGLPVAIYDPTSNYQSVRNKLYGRDVPSGP